MKNPEIKLKRQKMSIYTSKKFKKWENIALCMSVHLSHVYTLYKIAQNIFAWTLLGNIANQEFLFVLPKLKNTRLHFGKKVWKIPQMFVESKPVVSRPVDIITILYALSGDMGLLVEVIMAKIK